jgi:hypothetical protein
MSASIAMAVLGLCFGGLAWGIGRVESRAKTCSVHSRAAGRAAVVLGVLSGLTGAALIIGAFLCRRAGL